MGEYASGLLDDLEEAMRGGNAAARNERLLNGLVEHFVATARNLGADHIELFDILILRLLGVAEADARAGVSRRFAPLEVAPPASLSKLARDHITIAAPLLLRSPCLTDELLREIAEFAGQPHLLAISRRAALSDRLTDLLVARGERSVHGSLIHNPGARFSEAGFAQLMTSTARDPAIQRVLAQRPDLPPHFAEVMAEASRPAPPEESVEEVPATKAVPAASPAPAPGPMSTMPAAMIKVAGMAVEAGGLTEAVVASFARAGQRLELMCALATMTRMPLPIVQKALDADRPGAVLLMARALNFTFSTVRLALRLRPQGPPTRGDLDRLQKEFEEMSPAKAWAAIGFMASRKDGRDGVAAA